MGGNMLNLAKDLGKMVNAVVEPDFDTKKQSLLVKKIMAYEDCENCIFFECTKRNNRIWLANTTKSYKFLIEFAESIFDMSTVHNFHKKSGYALFFNEEFDLHMKEVFERIFYDDSAKKERALVLYQSENKIYISHFRLDNQKEIGPRIILKLEKEFEGCFEGKVRKIN